MDDTDKKILNILQANARTNIKEIGSKVGLTSPAVSERIRKLEENQIITGYHAHINRHKLDKSISVFIMGDIPPSKFNQFIEFCNKTESIVELHHVIGSNNVILLAYFRDTPHMEKLILSLKCYGKTETSVILSTLICNKLI